MKYFTVALWVILSVLAIGGRGVVADPQERGSIRGGVMHAAPGWFKESFLEIKDDVDEAAEANKHVLLFFQLNGCPYCDRMLREAFETDPLMSYIKTNFDVIAINVRGDRDVAFNEEVSVTEKELSELLKVRATPGVLFLNADNKPVARVDGYRSPERFGKILRYVSSKAYATKKLSEYLDENRGLAVYTLRSNPMFKEVTDLAAVTGPLAVIFEDRSCDDCNEFHDEVLSNLGVKKELQVFTLVRLDADSTEDIIDPEGNKTSPKAWARELEMTYRPGVVMYADGELLRRYDSLLFTHHFKEGFRWISSGSYKHEDYQAYSERRTEELLSAGTDINLGR